MATHVLALANMSQWLIDAYIGGLSRQHGG